MELFERRHSVRRFLAEPVPSGMVEALLRSARLAPSSANLQPGRFLRVAGGARTRLTAATLAAYREGRTEAEDYTYFPDPLPAPFKRRQVMAAKALYQALEIERDDLAARSGNFERNFTFFDAPVAIVVTIDARLGSGCYMDLGMCLYGLLLAAAAHGLGGCAIGALAAYPRLIRETLGLPAGEHIVCGVALGYPDETAPENAVRTGRLALADYFSVIE